MNKLVLSLAITASLGLTACDSDTVKDVQQEVAATGPAVTPSARIVFDPAATVPRLSVPNDLLFQNTLDGTLNMPGEVSAAANGIAPDYADPSTALGSLDGWSVAQPFPLGIDFPDGTSLDAASAANPSSTRIFQVLTGGNTTDADCASLTRGHACKIVKELIFGQDFATQASGNSVVVVPLKPLQAKTTYLLTLTDSLQDSNGKSVAGSTTYELVQQDITTHPLGSESQLGLQAAINSFETAVSGAGVDKDSIIYTMTMTTQSTVDSSFAVKSVMGLNAQAYLASAGAAGSIPTVGIQDTGASVADILAGNIPAASIPLYSAANYLRGSITLPYYLGIPSMANPMAPVNDRIHALCDSGATLAGLAASNPAAIPAEAVSATDAQCMAISQASGLPAPGLRDLSALFPVDTQRHITKFNPVPAPSAASDMPWITDTGTLEVQMTTPDLVVVNSVRAAMNLPALVKPENGWPVVILQHGFRMYKEQMLVMSGALAINGLATVAIDLPLHGSRGFDITGPDGVPDGVDDINASISALHFANLASLTSARDNFKQANADMLGLRFGLNFMGGVDPLGNPIDLELDTSKVHFFGLSLGAIAGINFVGLANTPLDPNLDGMFKVSTTSLVAPGLMFANFGIESPEFEPLAKSNLTLGLSPDFQALVATSYPDGASQDELNAIYAQFYGALSAEQQAGLNAGFAQFTFAAQTVLDAGDPISYVGIMAATQTPTHLIEIVGNGIDNLPDQVVTNTAPFTPLGGTNPAIALLGLPAVSEQTVGDGAPISGAVRFVYGHHSSVINPAHYEGVTASPELTGRATTEMQTQVATFFASDGVIIPVVDTELVQ